MQIAALKREKLQMNIDEHHDEHKKNEKNISKNIDVIILWSYCDLCSEGKSGAGKLNAGTRHGHVTRAWSTVIQRIFVWE